MEPHSISPFEDLNGFRYHDNWLRNFLTTSSLNGRGTSNPIKHKPEFLYNFFHQRTVWDWPNRKSALQMAELIDPRFGESCGRLISHRRGVSGEVKPPYRQ